MVLPEQVLDGWKDFGYDYSEEEIKEATWKRLWILASLKVKPFAEPILNHNVSNKDQRNYGSSLIQ